jgi:hypothetical protein
MLPERFVAIVNLAGFTAALALYAMLLAMVPRRPRGAMEPPPAASGRPGGASRDRLLLATALLGLVWNLAALRLYGFGGGLLAPPLEALALTALGFLPAVRAEGELLHVTTARNERHTVACRLKDLERRLDPARFVRLGRGDLANVDMIAKVNVMPGGTYVVVLPNGQELAVSRIQSRILRDRLLRL